MKQNGVRLVQRKFAQGVPIPASSISVAPTPPERKPDPPYSPKNVYHNNMSARNLLDIVSMQNIHKHKQEPLVVLERLRDDEIPSPVVPNGRCVRPRIRVPLRRRKVKGNKGNMCLRSGKRKSTDAGKGPTKKRKKLSSESTDDIPLVYYFNNRPAKPHNRQHRQKDITVTDKKQKASIREKRTPAPKKTVTKERSDSTVDKPPSRAESKASDGSFTFKEPSSPARLSYRLFKKTAAAATARQLKKGLPKDARWSTLRSARAPSETRSIVRRLRNKVLLGKKPAKPAVRKPGPKTNKDDTPAPPGPSGFRVPRPPPSESSENTSKAGPSGFKAPRPPPTETIAAPPSSRRASLESIDLFLAVKEEVENSGRPCGMVEVFAPSYPPSPVPSNGVEDWCLPPAIKASRSLKSLSDISSDIIRLGTPPGWTATPEFQDPQSEGDLVRGKEIMDENIKKELEEIRFEVSDKIEMKSKKSSEKNNVSDNEDSGIDVRAKKNQNTNKAKTDKDSEKAGQKHERDKEDKKAGHKEGKKVGHKDDRDKEGKKVEQKDERDKEGKKIDQKDERAKEGKKVGQKDEKDKEGKKVGHQDDRDKEGKKVEQKDERAKEGKKVRQKDEREKEGKKVGQKDERDKEGKKIGQKDERDKEDKNTGQIDEGDNIEKKAGQSGEGDKLEKKAGHRNERDKEDKKAGEKNKRENDDISKPDDATKRIKGKGVGKKTVQKETRGRKPKVAPVKEKKTLPKRAAKAAPAQEEVATNTRLLRNSRDPPPPNPDVYEFDELEGSRPPSGLRRRNQPTPDPPAQSPESIRYMDICPTSSQLVKINTKKEEVGNVLSVSLVPKDDIYKKQKNWIDNLTNRPALLNKFFNCLPTELQNELGSLATEGTGREEAYLDEKAGTVLEAPTYYPTAEEFEDPIKYYDKIAPEASKYGLCKIVPPENFKPTCTMSDTIRFAVIYQYISKMYSRWGPVSRELAAIKAHLRTQSVVFARSPLLDGSEVNLPRLYHAVERNGGLSNVIQRKRWGRVADEMKLTKLQHPERKLDPIYMRYLLPYATLSDQERQSIMAEVEKCWTTKYQKMLERARNPFQRQNRMLGTECESESDDEGEDGNTAGALQEAEDCIVQGRTMNLVTFKKIATSLMDAHFDPSKQPPGAVDVEKAYWRAVLLGTEHIVANTASIDTGEEGYGFPKDPQADYGAHPWNLKVLARNPNNVLRYLGPVLGVTVPTLHLSMLFSTSCWHRDPHGLPWTEYMHSGAEKIWYGIPRDESANFRRAVETLCPAYCQNKSIWLASEITMVPPNILSEHGVKLSRLLQRPGEYVLVFPEAHSCSITTGFGISESVYFASNAWLTDVFKLFQELRNSCEPTMFSLEQLLLNGSADSSAPHQVCSVLATLLSAELEHRRALDHKGLKVQERPPSSAPLNTSYFRAWNTRDQDECEYCRSTLFLSKVTGLTGRKSAVCPEHALRLLETRKHKNVDLHTLEFLSSFTTPALEEMLERLDARTAGDQSAHADPE